MRKENVQGEAEGTVAPIGGSDEVNDWLLRGARRYVVFFYTEGESVSPKSV